MLYELEIKNVLHFKLSKSDQILCVDKTCFPRPGHISIISLFSLMYGTILTFIKLNNFDTRCLNGSRHLFPSFCYATWHIFEPLHVYEPGFNKDKYGT